MRSMIPCCRQPRDDAEFGQWLRRRIRLKHLWTLLHQQVSRTR